MNNQEKVREIVDKELNAQITLANRHQAEFSLEGHCEKVALEMAEWKDKQFKEYLEKKLSDMEYARMRILDDYQQGFYDGRESSMREIINELFGE